MIQFPDKHPAETKQDVCQELYALSKSMHGRIEAQEPKE
jgi:hypothetical protein